MEKLEIQQALNAHRLAPTEIECRVGQTYKAQKGVSILLYKNARVDMAVLDKIVGAASWQRDHKEIKGNLYCGVGIQFGSEWVWKWDCGVESNTEAEKGEASDSFKRACVNWGIGRELYTSPRIALWNLEDKEWNEGKPRISLVVTHIAYDENGVITELTLADSKTLAVRWTMGTPSQVAKAKPAENKLPVCTMSHFKSGRCGKLISYLAKTNPADVNAWREDILELKKRYTFEAGVLDAIENAAALAYEANTASREAL